MDVLRKIMDNPAASHVMTPEMGQHEAGCLQTQEESRVNDGDVMT
jgi:hypothetical protein